MCKQGSTRPDAGRLLSRPCHHTYGVCAPAVLSAEPTQHRGAQSQRRTGPMQTHAGHQCQLRPATLGCSSPPVGTPLAPPSEAAPGQPAPLPPRGAQAHPPSQRSPSSRLTGCWGACVAPEGSSLSSPGPDPLQMHTPRGERVKSWGAPGPPHHPPSRQPG